MEKKAVCVDAFKADVEVATSGVRIGFEGVGHDLLVLLVLFVFEELLNFCSFAGWNFDEANQVNERLRCGITRSEELVNDVIRDLCNCVSSASFSEDLFSPEEKTSQANGIFVLCVLERLLFERDAVLDIFGCLISLSLSCNVPGLLSLLFVSCNFSKLFWSWLGLFNRL